VIYSLAMLGVIGIGLATREYHVKSMLGKYPGDALWATMVYLGLGVLIPTIQPWRLALISAFAAYGVEFSQMIQEPWIRSIRQTVLGHLVLGSTFNCPDLIAYTVGVALAFFAELRVLRLQRRPF
jgi:Protein of unknown function (DUF2809)